MAQFRGQFPLPFQGAQTGDGAICLAPGGTYALSSGTYLCSLGPNTTAQWFDPQAQKWRTFNADFIPADGCNYRLVNLSGSVVGGTVSNAGSGATNGIGAAQTGVTVAFSAPAAGGAPATATGYAIVGGSVAAPTITQGGSGFIAPPLILIDPPPPGGVQATAVATVLAGAVTAITMVVTGAGYQSSPNFWVIPQMLTWTGGPIDGLPLQVYPPPGTVYPNNLPPGIGSSYQNNLSPTGCQLTPSALTGSGTVTGFNLVSGGFGYTVAATATVTGAGTGALTVVMSATVPGAADTSYIQSRTQ
jgi:hypothetical protein